MTNTVHFRRPRELLHNGPAVGRFQKGADVNEILLKMALGYLEEIKELNLRKPYFWQLGLELRSKINVLECVAIRAELHDTVIEIKKIYIEATTQIQLTIKG